MSRVVDVEQAHACALNLDAQRTVRAALEALDAERAVLFARQLRMLAELARLSVERPSHAVLEVAGTLGVGHGRASTLLEHGRRAVELFPRAVQLLETGAVRPATVELLLWVTAKASEAVQAEVGVRISDALIGCDAVDARALIVATMLEVEADLDLEAVKQRHAQARANRGVWVKPVEDGMARIGAEVDQISAMRFQLDLDALCRAQKQADAAAGIERTVEQRRADVLAELPSRHLALLHAFQHGTTTTDLLGQHCPASEVLAQLCALPVRNPATLLIHTPMSTQLALDNRAGWAEGLGPISAHQVRLLRPSAALQALWVDADTGIPLGLDPTTLPPVGGPDWDDKETVSQAAAEVRRRLRALLQPALLEDRVEAGRFPSTTLARFIKIRDLRCTGPGCPMPASRCELDHLTPVSEGGPTSADNLALKSPRCHHARHDGWTATRNELDGSTTWDSPAGGAYPRRSPWQPPPPIRGPLPPPTLDRPDGGTMRTFGTDPAPDDISRGHATDLPVPRTAADATEQPPRRKTALDHVREIQQCRPETSTPAPYDRPWHSDDPPPF